MRRVLLLAIAALALLAPSAAAQSPIAGGGSFNDAPVLAPGRSSDTIGAASSSSTASISSPGRS